MFDIGWSELLLIGIVALIAIGPKELPGALRTLGQWMAKIRRMAAEFQGQFQEAMREAEIDQLKKDMDDMAAKAKDYTAVRSDGGRAHATSRNRSAICRRSTSRARPTPTDGAGADRDRHRSRRRSRSRAAMPAPADLPAADAEPATATTPAAPEPEPAIADAKPDAGRAPA